jgi:hypothetical protein
MSAEDAIAKDRAAGRPVDPEYGSASEARAYLRRKHREKNALMKQFCKLEAGAFSSQAYRDGYDAIDWSKT